MNGKIKVVGYTRVSTEEQVGNASKEVQEKAIKKYADDNNMEVVEWYWDGGFSAKTAHRPDLVRMLGELSTIHRDVQYVVVYNSSRMSRNMDSFYQDIEPVLTRMGVSLRSTQEPFDDSAIGKFIRNQSFAYHQLDNDMKSEVVQNNMAEVAGQGWWQSTAPLGMKIEKVTIGERDKDGKEKKRSILVPDDTETGEMVKQVLERFAMGDQKPMDAVRYAEKLGLKTRKGKPIAVNSMIRMLGNAAYANQIQSENLTKMEMVQGRGIELISLETHLRIKEILNNDGMPLRSYKKEDPLYSLKHTAICPVCKRPLRGSAPKNGSGKGSPRYHCAYCRGVGSLSPEKAHAAFEELLDEVTPNEDVLNLFGELTKRAMRRMTALNKDEIEKTEAKLAKIDEQISEVIAAFVAHKISMEEKELFMSNADKRKSKLQDELDRLSGCERVSNSMIDRITALMKSPRRIWKSVDYNLKQLIQQMIFPNGVELDMRAAKCGTDKISPLYSVIMRENGLNVAKNCNLVISARVELALLG
ncbi:recombinase family protein [Candidatus Saccharibacteria bacterium]|nr:recombinase family protein [Candidatus Saccharibacteria bacterium]